MAELSEKSFPFDSEEINGEWDREYVADDFARYFRSFISSGVFMRTSSNLQVIANGDMTVTLKPGALMVDGYRYDAENDIVIQLDPADGVLNRIDRISGTWSKADRDIHFTLQKGVPSYEPLPATLRRTAEYKDYVFADIYVAAGAISIKQTDITDQRLNTEVCGLATPFAEFDTTTLYQKIEAYYAEMQARTENWTQEEKEKFTTWFDDIKNQLAGDVAANLQLQIGTLDALKTKNKSNLVAAINEVNEKEVDVLDTREEIQANTTAGKVAGALPVKELYSSLADGRIQLVVNEDNSLGYKLDGADTVIPFSSSGKKFKVGSYNSNPGTYDIKTVLEENGVDYTQITSDNFFIRNLKIQAYSNLQIISTDVGISYNSTNGNLTLTGIYLSGTSISIWVSLDIWVCL